MNENINLEFYKVFYVVAKYLNITKASEILYVSQPAVTQSIKKLEEQLGGKLFYRQSKGVILTEEGKNLYNYIKASMESLDNAAIRFSQYANLEEGTIRLRVGTTIGKSFVYERLGEFLKKYPKIKIDGYAGKSESQIDELAKGNVDMVFVTMPETLEYSNIEVSEFFEDNMVIFTTDEYLKTLDFKITKLEDLSKVKIAAPRKGSNARIMLDHFFEDKNVEFNPVYEATSMLRLGIVLSGVGVGIGHKKILQEYIESGKIKILDISNELPKNKTAIATLKREACSFATLKLLDFMLEDVKNEEE